MATLKELMGDKTRGDGRKFRLNGWDLPQSYFEPIFLDGVNNWYGVDETDSSFEFSENGDDWQEWHPPKKTKKIKMIRYIIKDRRDRYYQTHWYTGIENQLNLDKDKIVKIEEKEIEVDE